LTAPSMNFPPLSFPASSAVAANACRHRSRRARPLPDGRGACERCGLLSRHLAGAKYPVKGRRLEKTEF
jgi:hypothetical protein